MTSPAVLQGESSGDSQVRWGIVKLLSRGHFEAS
jgi:hypothetical protein